MKNQYFQVMEEDWDYLVVLDACRFDFFSDLYSRFFKGELKKQISLGSSTIDWCKNTFSEYYDDVVYISGNPYINSKYSVAGFNAREHFFRIFDIWKIGWNDDIGTVHPGSITEISLYLKKFYPDKRFIIHYLQPHSPYLSPLFDSTGYPEPDLSNGNVIKGVATYGGILSAFNNQVVKFSDIILTGGLGIGNVFPRKVMELLHLPPHCPIDEVRRKYGIMGLRQAYAENLKLVLSYVSKLSHGLGGRMVITSDHGEFLGEHNMIGHPDNNQDPIVREVPWFLVENVIMDPFASDKIPNKM